MTTQPGRAEIDRELEILTTDLASAPNYRLAGSTAGLCSLLDRPDLSTRIAAVLARTPVDTWLQGALTNIDLADVNPERLRRPHSAEDISREHPICSDESIAAHLTACAQTERHLAFVLRGDLEGAARAASDNREMQEIGEALAVLGQPERALTFIDTKVIENSRRHGVRYIVSLETCRREHRVPPALRNSPLNAWSRFHVILALANRLPWTGYPFADY
jgi:hypothetical protein